MFSYHDLKYEHFVTNEYLKTVAGIKLTHLPTGVELFKPMYPNTWRSRLRIAGELKRKIEEPEHPFLRPRGYYRC